MKLIIDIPDKLKTEVYNHGLFLCPNDKTALVNAIKHGTPLPKGHGRLIDVDELLTSERPKGIADDVWKESHIYKLLSNTPTIIEADKERSDKE